jgi:VIT1/CCC1 family predicted Fe2+/Mn2+ transporter
MLEKVRVLTRHIRPINALQELIYGLVMSLATISVVSLTIGLDESTRHTLALSVLGVNITWGLADMLIFSVLESFDRSRHRKVIDWVFSEPDEDWALDAIRDDLSGTIIARLDPADRERIYLDVLESGNRALEPHPKFSLSVLKGSLIAFMITVAASFPVVLTVMLVNPIELAHTAASAIAVLLLFLTGFVWAPLAGISRWRAGVALMGIGLLITLSTLFIGG